MSSQVYDVVVIGGGIIGLASALHINRRFPKARVAVLEKEQELALHQTGHNSGVIHSGIYYRPGSHKARFCVDSVQKIMDYCQEKGIKYHECGKVIVATSGSEIPRLEELHGRGTANGVPDLEVIGIERLREIEPHALGVKALYAPRTAIVDFKKVAAAYAQDFLDGDGQILTGRKVTRIARANGSLELDTPQGAVSTKHLVNCAGLYADKVARMMGVPAEVRIIPFRGEYYVLRPESQGLVRGLIYPVPDPKFPFLGVHYTKRITGEVEAGPNAVMAWAQEGYRKSNVNLFESLGNFAYPGFWRMALKTWKVGLGEMHRSLMRGVFVKDLQRLVPEIRPRDILPGGAGVRAQAVSRDGRLLDDFRIEEAQGAIHVLNAPSPGATSSLSIGAHIADLAGKSFGLGD